MFYACATVGPLYYATVIVCGTPAMEGVVDSSSSANIIIIIIVIQLVLDDWA